jgi:hypothetical protein
MVNGELLRLDSCALNESISTQYEYVVLTLKPSVCLLVHIRCDQADGLVLTTYLLYVIARTTI